MSETGILLESGTNELEIVEFKVGNSLFGINVIKVREIIIPKPMYKIPYSHPYLEGVTQIRGEVLPVIDLATVLQLHPSNNPKKDKFIVTEFNQMKVIFHVHDVSLIRRISWEGIVKPESLHGTEEYHVTGIVQLDTHMILLLDFEKIMVDMNPSSGMYTTSENHLRNRKQRLNRILIAEDSVLIQRLLKETLESAGYNQLLFFSNGKEAFDFLVQQEPNFVEVVITDIEVPQMDGHHFTKRIKESERFKDLPVIIFSSLITDDLRHKGEKVGADAQVSKPEVNNLVEIIDGFISSSSKIVDIKTF